MRDFFADRKIDRILGGRARSQYEKELAATARRLQAARVAEPPSLRTRGSSRSGLPERTRSRPLRRLRTTASALGTLAVFGILGVETLPLLPAASVPPPPAVTILLSTADRGTAAANLRATVARTVLAESDGTFLVLGPDGEVVTRFSGPSGQPELRGTKADDRRSTRTTLLRSWLDPQDRRSDLPTALASAAGLIDTGRSGPPTMWVVSDALPVSRLRTSDLTPQRIRQVERQLKRQSAADAVPQLWGTVVNVAIPGGDDAAASRSAAARHIWELWSQASGARVKFLL